MENQGTLTVAVTGATGFVGRYIVKHLLERGHHVRALVRDPARAKGLDPAVEQVQGDPFQPVAVDALLKDADAVIHLIGIIREQPRRGQTFERIHHEAVAQLADAAARHEVKRFVHMSALGARSGAPSIYHRTKYLGELEARSHSLDWTIIRPSLIHGPSGEFTDMLRDFWCKLFPPFVPYFGQGAFGRNGSGYVQPVYIEDVARCFVDALDRPQTIGQIYELGGAEQMDWPTMYRTFAKHLPKARRKPIIAIPIWLALGLAVLPGTPFNRAQVLMAAEDSVCSIGAIERDFAFIPMGFDESLTKYLAP